MYILYEYKIVSSYIGVYHQILICCCEVHIFHYLSTEQAKEKTVDPCQIVASSDRHLFSRPVCLTLKCVYSMYIRVSVSKHGSLPL